MICAIPQAPPTPLCLWPTPTSYSPAQPHTEEAGGVHIMPRQSAPCRMCWAGCGPRRACELHARQCTYVFVFCVSMHTDICEIIGFSLLHNQVEEGKLLAFCKLEALHKYICSQSLLQLKLKQSCTCFFAFFPLSLTHVDFRNHIPHEKGLRARLVVENVTHLHNPSLNSGLMKWRKSFVAP